MLHSLAHPGSGTNELQYIMHKGTRKEGERRTVTGRMRRSEHATIFLLLLKKRVESMTRKMVMITNNANSSLWVTVAQCPWILIRDSLCIDLTVKPLPLSVLFCPSRHSFVLVLAHSRHFPDVTTGHLAA